VIPAQAGIQCVEFQLFRINFETLIPSFPRTYIPSFPRKWESSFLSFSHSR
ncbi:pilS cassette, partial [Neisseria meningitidis]